MEDEFDTINDLLDEYEIISKRKTYAIGFLAGTNIASLVYIAYILGAFGG